MEEVKQFLQEISTDPKAKGLMKGMKEPENVREAAAVYHEVAEKLGYQLTKNDIKTILAFMEKNQKEQTAKTECSVKQALDDSALDAVAGGGENYDNCDSTAYEGEWCWFSDSCSLIINYYSNEPVKVDYKQWDCVNDAFDGTHAEECGSTYVDLDNDMDW